MEVLDTTIANVVAALHRRRSGGQRGRGVLGGDDLSGRQRHHPDGESVSRANARAQELLPHLPRAIHRQLDPVRHSHGTCNRCCCSACCKASAAAAWCRSRSRSWPTAFPPEKRGQAFAVFGVAVVVAPVVGPTLGGWLSDNMSWRWCFLINGPVGVVAIGADRDRAARARETQSATAAQQGGAVRLDRLRVGRDVPRRARGRAGSRARGRLVRLVLHRHRSPSFARWRSC